MWCFPAWVALPICAQLGGQSEAELKPLPHPEIAPPALPAEATSGWPLVLGGIVALGLLAVVVWLLFLRKSETTEQAMPPLKHALQRLEALRKLLDQLTTGEAAHEVSVILRDYLQARYAVPAPYRTSEELYNEAAIQARDGLRERFGPVAEFYDRLEFAPRTATRQDIEKLVEEAIKVLRDEKRYSPGALPPPLPQVPSLPFVPTKM
jgi:hypothetical protein